ncbi:MAG: VRR-NUC domain-containing protein [Gammaproteobacteria bacterium]|nr:VRR-NUC domain-containing protein [Gammaproteobacteria bacterium]
MKESEIQRAVISHWHHFGHKDTLVAAIPNDGARGQYGLTAGLPDLLVIAPKFMGLIELKTEKGRLSMAQDAVVSLCSRNEIPVAVTYGRDEPIEILEKWNIVRRVA